MPASHTLFVASQDFPRFLCHSSEISTHAGSSGWYTGGTRSCRLESLPTYKAMVGFPDTFPSYLFSTNQMLISYQRLWRLTTRSRFSSLKFSRSFLSSSSLSTNQTFISRPSCISNWIWRTESIMFHPKKTCINSMNLLNLFCLGELLFSGFGSYLLPLFVSLELCCLHPLPGYSRRMQTGCLVKRRDFEDLSSQGLILGRCLVAFYNRLDILSFDLEQVIYACILWAFLVMLIAYCSLRWRRPHIPGLVTILP